MKERAYFKPKHNKTDLLENRAAVFFLLLSGTVL